MAKIKFDWDAGNLGKCAARVPIAEIEALFNGGVMRVRRDPCPREEGIRASGRTRSDADFSSPSRTAGRRTNCTPEF